MIKKKKRAEDVLSRGQSNLEANRQGYITAQQKDWLRRDMDAERQRQLKMIYVSSVIFLVVIVILVLMPFVPIPIAVPPVVWGIGVAAGYGYIWWQQKPIRDDLAVGKAGSITGHIDKSTTLGYHVTISGVDYATPPDMYDAFDETQHYTIYHTPDSNIVLSAEIVDEFTDYDTESDNSQAETDAYFDDDSQFQSDRFERQ